jgi:hypothetical protein
MPLTRQDILGYLSASVCQKVAQLAQTESRGAAALTFVECLLARRDGIHRSPAVGIRRLLGEARLESRLTGLLAARVGCRCRCGGSARCRRRGGRRRFALGWFGPFAVFPDFAGRTISARLGRGDCRRQLGLVRRGRLGSGQRPRCLITFRLAAEERERREEKAASHTSSLTQGPGREATNQRARSAR